MICPNCGTEVNDGIRFCTSCGTDLTAQATQQPAYQQPVYQQPVYQQPVYQQPMYHQPDVPGKGFGIASMVVGIIAIVFFCVWYISIPCGILGAALGGVGINKAKMAGGKNGMAVAGISCACIALGITIVFWIFVAIGIAETNAFLASF